MTEWREMTVGEMMKETGYNRKSIQQRIDKAGLVPRYETRAGHEVAVYKVDGDFLRKVSDMVAECRTRGYVTAMDIAARNNVSSVHVRDRLRDAGVGPDVRCGNSWCFYADRPELDELVTRKRSSMPRPKRRKSEPADSMMGRIIEEERMKKSWVGRRGRLVVDGHVVAEGVIESVSSCGVYLEGSKVKGDLNELELSEPAG